MFPKLLFVLPVAAQLARRTPISDPRWGLNVKWQIEIQAPLDITKELVPGDAVVWDIDLWQANESGMIQSYLKTAENNRIVICYFSAGTVHDNSADGEGNDPDLDKFANVRKGNQYKGFPEEHWIDITSADTVAAMESRIQLAASLGCDGIDPDNIDGYRPDDDGQPQSGLGINQAAYQTYFNRLGEIARANNLMIGQKNAPELTTDSVGFADFAVLEGCRSSDDSPTDRCDTWQPYITAGKPVFQIEYPPSVQPCDVEGECENPVCPQGNVEQSEFDDYCGGPHPGLGNDSNFSRILKQDGDRCGLGNWTEYCNANTPLFVHLDTGDEEEPGASVRRWWDARQH